MTEVLLAIEEGVATLTLAAPGGGMSWREEAAQLPNLAPPPFGVNPSSTALVIVDMQYVDAHRDYALGVSLKRPTRRPGTSTSRRSSSS